jgi:hypothetical protein
MDLLTKVEADRGADGRYIISGEPVISGLGDEVVVPDATVYYRHGRPFSLARSLEQAGVGVSGFKVFDAGAGYQPNPASADANPEPDRHRAAYRDYLMNAENHIRAATPLLQQGRYVQAFGPIRHAECDIRQAYTEAVYAKTDDKDLAKMVQPLEHLFQQLQLQVQLMEAQL